MPRRFAPRNDWCFQKKEAKHSIIKRVIKKLLKHKHFFLFLSLFLAIPAVIALLKPGYYNMHDDMQMIRQLEMEKCFQDGQIPCRWTPDLGYGYGYPLFNFYPPLPYIVGQFFRFLGFSFMWSVKLTAIVHFFLTALFSYLLASSLFGPIPAVLASLFYTYAPYHALDIYVRGAMNEAWASTFFPAIFYFVKKLIEVKKNKSFKYFLFLSLSLVGLLLSHNPMLLIFSPFMATWSIFCLYQKYGNFKSIWSAKQKLLSLLLSPLFALALASFYTLPVLFESSLVQIDSMFTSYYNFAVHFTSLRQLFISNFWGDGPSVWGQADQMSFMVGYLHWFIPLLTLIISIFLLKKFNQKKQQNFLIFLFFFLSAFLTAFLTHERSIFLWKIFSPIQKIQFPWRFLNLSIFFFSLSISFFVKLFKKRSIQLYLSIVLISLLFLFNFNYFHPIHSGPLTDQQKFSGLAWRNQITSGIYDYLPKTASTAAKSQAKAYIDSLQPQQDYKIYGQKKGTDWLFFNLELKQPAKLTVSRLYFPNFKAFDNGKSIPISWEKNLGRIVLNLDKGRHQIYIKLFNTPIRSLSNIISLIAWSYLLSKLLKLKVNRLIKKRN